MLENSAISLLGNLNEGKLKELLNEISLITDPLGQELIKKASEAHSPINVKELSTIRNGLRDEALARLYRLENLGVFKSSFDVVNGQMKRVFSITEFGKRTEL